MLITKLRGFHQLRLQATVIIPAELKGRFIPYNFVARYVLTIGLRYTLHRVNQTYYWLTIVADFITRYNSGSATSALLSLFLSFACQSLIYLKVDEKCFKCPKTGVNVGAIILLGREALSIFGIKLNKKGNASDICLRWNWARFASFPWSPSLYGRLETKHCLLTS